MNKRGVRPLLLLCLLGVILYSGVAFNVLESDHDEATHSHTKHSDNQNEHSHKH